MDSAQRLRQVSGVPNRSVEGDGILISTEKGEAIVVNGSGLWIWQQLKDGASVHEICRQLSEKYGGDDSRFEPDVSKFLTTLSEKGLIEAVS